MDSEAELTIADQANASQMFTDMMRSTFELLASDDTADQVGHHPLEDNTVAESNGSDTAKSTKTRKSNSMKKDNQISSRNASRKLIGKKSVKKPTKLKLMKLKKLAEAMAKNKAMTVPDNAIYTNLPQFEYVPVKAYMCMFEGCSKRFLDPKKLMKHHKSLHDFFSPLLDQKIQLADSLKTKLVSKTPKKIKISDEIPENLEEFVANEEIATEEESHAEEDGREKKSLKYKYTSVQIQEIIINLMKWYQKLHPQWSKSRISKEIGDSCQVGDVTVRRVISHYQKFGTLKADKVRGKRPKAFVCTDTDRQILDRCIQKLKTENRLNGAHDVYNEITQSDEFNPSFKRASVNTFYRIFKNSGFKITETTIINKKPVARDAKRGMDRTEDGQWQCVWPGCGRLFGNGVNLDIHTRTHTQEKPYACRQADCLYRCTTMGNLQKHLKVHRQ